MEVEVAKPERNAACLRLPRSGVTYASLAATTGETPCDVASGLPWTSILFAGRGHRGPLKIRPRLLSSLYAAASEW